MFRSAARFDPRLLAALARLDAPERPMAETHRRLGLIADEIGVARPSYERVRCLIRDHRRRPISPGIGETLLDIALQNRPLESIIDALSELPR